MRGQRPRGEVEGPTRKKTGGEQNRDYPSASGSAPQTSRGAAGQSASRRGARASSGRGPRLGESLAMTAAIVRTFDLLSIVKVRDDLRDRAKILTLLGCRWSVVSDYGATRATN